MAGYTITKKTDIDLSKFLIITSILLVFSCIFLPFVIIYTYQDIFINNRIDSWFFTTPNKNYVTFAGALIWFAIVIVFFLVYRNKRLLQDSKVRVFPFILLLLPGFITIFLSLNHYFYLNDDGIHVNELWGFGTISYEWKDVAHVEQLQIVRNGIMVEGDLVFTFQNGDVFHLPVTKEVQLHKRQIYDELRKVNVEVKRTLPK